MVPILSSAIALVVIFFTVEQDILSELTTPTFDHLAYASSAVVGLIWSSVVALILSVYYVKNKPKIATAAGTYDSDHIEIKWD